MTLWVAEISATHFSILQVYYTIIKFFCQVFYATFLEFLIIFSSYPKQPTCLLQSLLSSFSLEQAWEVWEL